MAGSLIKRLDKFNKNGDIMSGNRQNRRFCFNKTARKTAVDISLGDFVGFPVVERAIFREALNEH